MYCRFGVDMAGVDAVSGPSTSPSGRGSSSSKVGELKSQVKAVAGDLMTVASAALRGNNNKAAEDEEVSMDYAVSAWQVWGKDKPMQPFLAQLSPTERSGSHCDATPLLCPLADSTHTHTMPCIMQEFRHFVQILVPAREVPSYLELIISMFIDVKDAFQVGTK